MHSFLQEDIAKTFKNMIQFGKSTNIISVWCNPRSSMKLITTRQALLMQHMFAAIY